MLDCCSTDRFTRMDAMQRPTHPATKTFMALRIFVNNELNELHNGLELAHQLLTPGGACAAIAFSSLEDRIIKRQFHGIDMNEKLNMTIKHKVRRSQSHLLPPEQLRTMMTRKKWLPVNRRPIGPDGLEMKDNPRSRSAKLRVATKVDVDAD